MVDVFLLESFPFLTSFYGNGRTKFPKNSWTAIVHNFVIDRGRGESGKPEGRPQLAMERDGTAIVAESPKAKASTAKHRSAASAHFLGMWTDGRESQEI